MKRVMLFLLASLFLLGSSNLAFGQERTVTGRVTDSTQSGLPGVSVSVKGTRTAAVTNATGAFTIQVPSSNAILVFSSVGFERQEVAAGSGSPLQVTLQTAVGGLNEVVVTALGIRREQRKLGYATTSIGGAEIIKTAPTNFASALYGKAPGVTINSNPGGATSAVAIQIRGVNSISFQRQPLLVVDGVIVRNGDANNEGYWGGNQRINANGLLDINPENIENINVLKGAAASALYGSDANFGVIVITTKNGRKNTGLGIEVNLSGNSEHVAVLPEVQTLYGPGYDRATNTAAFGANAEGFIPRTVNGQQVLSPIFRAYAQFGPKTDGRSVYWWDGQMRPYAPKGNPWEDFYRTGFNSVGNIAVSNATDKFNYRFSYTRNDYKGVQIGGEQQKNTFNLNSTFRLHPKLSTDLAITYVNEQVHNRPRQMDRITNNFGGFFSPIDDMDVYFNKYKTARGYKWVRFDQADRDPAEALKYNIRAYDFLDFLWTQLENSYEENSNRLIASATVNYEIVKNLRLRSRLGTDYTGYYLEQKDKSEYPVALGPTGYYGTANNRSTFTYGDVLLSYSRPLVADKLNLSASVGYQGRREDYRYSSQNTVGGLSTENWFSMSASSVQYDNAVQGRSSRAFEVKDGLFGIVGFDFNNYLFVEGTLRRERTSTLIPGNNVFFYPGVSGAFEISNAFNLPAFVSYSKLRAAWGLVGNPPGRYSANVIYNAGNINGVPVLTPPSRYGNDQLQNEEKSEYEIGWETRFLRNRLGFDVSYYDNTIRDQILYLSTPASVGASELLVNVGTMRNRGLEFSINGTPFRTQNFSWDARLNYAINRNEVVELMPGLDRLTLDNVDNGSLMVVAEKGKPSGDILGYKRKTNEQGQYIINSNGLYEIDFSQQVKLGNIQPKGSGGLMNTLNYKNLSMSFLVDFRWGQNVISPSLLYGRGSGLYENTLFGRDKEHGGISYYVDGTGKKVRFDGNANAGPNGEKVYHDGVLLAGVNGTDGKENTTIVEAASYYLNTFNWGSWPGSGSTNTYEAAVFNNDFIKMREVSLSYALPVHLRSKLRTQNLTFTLYGRNLFYFYKALPYLDPEEGVGTSYVSRARVGGGTAATRSVGASLRLSF